MKLSNLLAFTFLVFSTVFFAQSSQDTLKSTRSLKSDKRDLVIIRNQPNKAVLIDSSQTKTATKQTEWTVESLDKYIASIEKKMEWVKNNPAEDEKAKASGWYDKMNTFIKNAKIKREELIKKQK